jgi:hypothetical protein
MTKMTRRYYNNVVFLPKMMRNFLNVKVGPLKEEPTPGCLNAKNGPVLNTSLLRIHFTTKRDRARTQKNKGQFLYNNFI